MQHARFKPHAEERTCNPVHLRPNCRGQGTKKETPKDQQFLRSRRSSPAREYSLERKPKVAVLLPVVEGHQPLLRPSMDSNSYIIIISYSWKGGRAEAVCAGGKGVRMR